MDSSKLSFLNIDSWKSLFSSKGKVIGLDIGSYSLKGCVAEISLEKTQLIECIEVPIANNSLVHGDVMQPGGLLPTLETFFKQMKIKKADIILGLSGSTIMVKKVSLPKLKGRSLSEQIQWEAEQYIPFDLGDINLDYVSLSTQGEDSENLDVLIVAAQKEHIRLLVETIHQCHGCSVVVVDVNSFALANVFNLNYSLPEGEAAVLVDIGAFYTQFVVVLNKEVVFCRDLPVGGSLINQEIQSAMDISFEEAESFKLAKKDVPDVVVQALNLGLETICDQIQGSYEFFLNTSHDIKNIKSVFLTGGSSRSEGLVEILRKNIDLPFEFMDPLKRVDTTNTIGDTESLRLSGAVSLGLSFRSQGDASDSS